MEEKQVVKRDHMYPTEYKHPGGKKKKMNKPTILKKQKINRTIVIIAKFTNSKLGSKFIRNTV